MGAFQSKAAKRRKQENNPETDKSPDGTERKGLRWRRVIPIGLLGIPLLLWMAPAIAIRTPLRHTIVNYLFPAYTGISVVDSGEAGWTKPVVLHDVTLRDAKGRVWMTIDELATSKPLFALLFGNSGDLGTITLSHPVLSIWIRDDGSSFEDRLRELLADDGSSKPKSLTIKIVEGSASWTDAAGNEVPGGLAKFNATIHRSATASLPGPVHLATKVTSGKKEGTVQIDVAEPSDKQLNAKVVAEGVPLATLQAWFDRFGIEAGLTGTVSTHLSASCATETGVPVSLAGEIQGRQLLVTANRDGKPWRLEEFSVTGKLAADKDRLTFQNVILKSHVGQVAVTGAIARKALTTMGGGNWRQRIENLLAQTIDISGRIDLSRLPEALPWGMPSGGGFDSGHLRFSLKTGQDSAAQSATVHVTTSELIASLPKRKVRWDSPFTLDVVVRSDDSGLSAKQLHVKSDAMTLEGSLSATGGKITFDCDLDQLRQLLGQVVPIPAKALAGSAAGQCTVNRNAKTGVVQLVADATLRDFALAWNGMTWNEKEFHAKGNATVCLDDTKLAEMNALSVTLTGAGGDAVSAELVEKTTSKAKWPVRVTLAGSLRRWMNRLRAWSLLPENQGWSLAGTVDASALVVHHDSQTQLNDISGEIKQFQAQVAGLAIAEPQVTLAGQLLFDGQAGLLSSNDLRLGSETIAIAAKRMIIPLAKKAATEFEGTVHGSLARLSGYLLPTGLGWRLTGQLAGTIALSQQARQSTLQANLALAKPVLSRRSQQARGRLAWEKLWSDQSATLNISGHYAGGEKTLAIKQALWKSSGITLTTAGQIAQLPGAASADLTGQMTYDLALLRSHIPVMAEKSIQVAGKGSRQFSFKGPLLTTRGTLDPALAGQAGIGWQSINLWGIPLGPGELTVRLANQRINLATSRVAVAGGTAGFAGTVTATSPLTLVLEPGKVIEGVTITPQMCEQWMSFAAPMLAGATEVRGAFSLDLIGASVPLLNPRQAQGKAQLSIQQVVAEPGPIVRALLTTIQQIRQIAGGQFAKDAHLRILAPTQQVQVTVVNGRIYHDHFAIRLSNAQGPLITTRGSVGFDESLHIMAEIPLQASWFHNERFAKLLGGQTLKIPINGTLSQPIPNAQALRNLLRQAGVGAVENFLQRELGKQLGGQNKNKEKSPEKKIERKMGKELLQDLFGK